MSLRTQGSGVTIFRKTAAVLAWDMRPLKLVRGILLDKAAETLKPEPLCPRLSQKIATVNLQPYTLNLAPSILNHRQKREGDERLEMLQVLTFPTPLAKPDALGFPSCYK